MASVAVRRRSLHPNKYLKTIDKYLLARYTYFTRPMALLEGAKVPARSQSERKPFPLPVKYVALKAATPRDKSIVLIGYFFVCQVTVTS
jgi:hypothetical protein